MTVKTIVERLLKPCDRDHTLERVRSLIPHVRPQLCIWCNGTRIVSWDARDREAAWLVRELVLRSFKHWLSGYTLNNQKRPECEERCWALAFRDYDLPRAQYEELCRRLEEEDSR